MNPSLFSLCFTGKTQASSRCDLGLSSSHGTRECVWVGEGEQDVPACLQAMEASVDMSKPLGRGTARHSRDSQNKGSLHIFQPEQLLLLGMLLSSCLYNMPRAPPSILLHPVTRRWPLEGEKGQPLLIRQ